MAFNYKCGQFDDSFSPKRLGNWNDAARPSRCLKTRCGVYFRRQIRQPQHQKFSVRDFIANDSGHLLPEVREKICQKTNHWGLPVVGVWDELFQCCDGYTQKKSTCEKDCTLSIDQMPKYFRCRSPLAVCANAGCSVLDDSNAKYCLELEFERLQARCPPVIWIYGQPQKAIEEERLRFSGGLAKKLGFIYINPERVLTVLAMRYLHYSPRKSKRAWYWSDDGKSGGFFSLFSELPTILLDCPQSIQRIVALIQNIICNQPTEAFNTRGILEIIKLLFVTFPSARGYVLDGFPVALSEADDYETEFWPVTAGIYFTSKQWKSKRKRGCNPPLVYPSFFLRSSDYWESLVEETANEFRESCIKLDNAECLNERDFCYIVNSMKDIVNKYNKAMSLPQIEFESDEECGRIKRGKSSDEPVTPKADMSTSAESTPTPTPSSREEEPKPPPAETPEEEDEFESSSSEELEEFDPDLEHKILDEFETPEEKQAIDNRRVKAFYRHRRDPYSHRIPDKAGIETQFGTGLRHRHVADLLKKEQTTQGAPLSGKLFFTDPAKPDNAPPRDNKTLFADEPESEDIYLDEKAYVQKALKLEKEKLRQDLADRKYRRNLSYTTYLPEPPANPETIHTLYPPLVGEARSVDSFQRRTTRHGKISRHESQRREVFRPDKMMKEDDEQIPKTDVPKPAAVPVTPDQTLDAERIPKGRRGKKQKKTLFDKVKGKWIKFRRYIKPVVRPVEFVGAPEKLLQWAREHEATDKKKVQKYRRKKGRDTEEFRYN